MDVLGTSVPPAHKPIFVSTCSAGVPSVPGGTAFAEGVADGLDGLADGGVIAAMSQVYPMLHPVRAIGSDGPVTVHVHSQVEVVLPPSSATGPTALPVPLTGHNLLVTITADGQDVTLEHLEITGSAHATMDPDGVRMCSPVPMPPFSADFVEPVLRSAAAYRPLRFPDFELDVDSRAVRPLTRTLPLRVPAGEAVTVVCAPVTRVPDLVRWTLAVDVTADAGTERATWNLAVTAQTFLVSALRGQGEPVPVHALYPEHWHGAYGGAPTAVPTPMAHIAADGTVRLRVPLGEGGSNETAQADRLLQAGEVDQAEQWFRRGMAAGDWEAVAGWGQLLWWRRAPEAETVLHMAVHTTAASSLLPDDIGLHNRRAAAQAAELLAALLLEQGRVVEAFLLWDQVTDEGLPVRAPAPGAVLIGGWYLLRDARWRDPDTTVASMMGGWKVAEDGTLEPFQPNPDYEPVRQAVPTDPVHALLRLIADGHADLAADRLVRTVLGSVVEIACDEHDIPLICRSPDDMPCFAVVTAATHRPPGVDRWIPVPGSTLAVRVPDGVDLLLNPGDTAQFRLFTKALRPE